MIPTLYERIEYIQTRTAPTWTRIGSLRDTLSCVETSTVNAEWELVMEYPMIGLHANDIQIMRIIYTTQPFYIYRIVKNAALHTMTVYARHITYLLSFNVAFPFGATNCTPAQFLNNLGALLCVFNFTISSEMAELTRDVQMLTGGSVAPSNVRTFMLDPKYGMTAYYGGEWVFDNLNCTLKQRKGETKNIKIKYGIDLIDAKQDEALDNLVTHIVPYAFVNSPLSYSIGLKRLVYTQGTQQWTQGYPPEIGTRYFGQSDLSYVTQTVSATPHIYIFTNSGQGDTANVTVGQWFSGAKDVYALPGSENLPFKKIKLVNLMEEYDAVSSLVSLRTSYSDQGNSVTLSTGFAFPSSDNRIQSTFYNQDFKLQLDGMTVNYAQLRTIAQDYVNKHPVTFPVDITVQSLPQFMEGIKLGDSITVEYPDYGISTEAEIITMEYDVLREMIVSYTLGKGRTSFAETMLHQDDKIEQLNGLVTARNPLKGT